jgi:phage terminase small subunit
VKKTTLRPVPGGDGTPQEPDWGLIYDDEMDRDFAHEDWGRVVREMREASTLAVVNGHAIGRLVQFRVQHERAARHVAEKGAILPPTSKKAKVGQWNPYWSVMRQSDESIRILEAELGIAPVRRNRAGKVARRPKTARAADAYLKAVKG